MNNKILGEKIRFHRKALGLSQTALAGKLYITPQNLSKWEKGISNPDVWNLRRLSEILKVSCDYLLGNGLNGNDDKIMLAVDGGSTKTEFLMFNEKGEIVKHLVLSGSNPNACGMNEALSVLKSGIDSMLSVCSDISCVFLGLSGCGDVKNKKVVTDFLEKSYYGISFEVQSDLYNIIHTEIPAETYVSVICGTGSSLGVKTSGGVVRIGGYGYLFDESCCGYTLGKNAIFATMRYENGVGEETLIAEKVEKALGAKAMDEINTIYGSGKDYIASFSGIVLEAYDEGDRVAKRIIDKSIYELAYLINHSVTKYNTSKIAVLSGGLTKRADVFMPFLKSYCPDIEFVITDIPQIFGAAVYCCNKYAKADEKFTENLREQYLSYLEDDNNA